MNKFPLSIIEGFYGRIFSAEDRKKIISTLSDADFNSYIFAPKACKNLRISYLNGLSKEEMLMLKDLGQHCHRENYAFGIGITPLNLTLNYKDDLPRFLELCSVYANELELDILAVLFDDLKITDPKSGSIQAQILADVKRSCPNLKILFCPTYYCLDPILERLFGPRPESYFEDLRNIDKDIDIFWTGNSVLSSVITPEDLLYAAKLLGRKPYLWDNYPVNDGKKISRFLHLRPVGGRDGTLNYLCGYAANPMNQCCLNELPLRMLSAVLKGKPKTLVNEDFMSHASKILEVSYAKLNFIIKAVQDEGLDKMSADTRAELLSLCDLKMSNPYFAEIRAFLNEVYAFDPKCLALTDQ